MERAGSAFMSKGSERMASEISTDGFFALSNTPRIGPSVSFISS